MTAPDASDARPVRSRVWSPRRHAAGWTTGTLLLTVLGTAAGILSLARDGQVAADYREGVLSSLCYLIPYGLAGAFLLRRRPDLPFGWLLSGAAVALAVSLAVGGLAVDELRRGSTASWPVWAAAFGGLQFVEIGVQGLINVRFPSGRIGSRWGRVIDVLMIAGLVLVVLSGLLGTAVADQIGEQLHRPVQNPLTGDGPIARLADGLMIAAPLIVLLGLVAGLRIIVLARRARGIERQQLLWRATGVVASLALFPFAVAGALPSVADFVDGAVFVATLTIPVLRYRLWEIDTVIRRSVAYGLVTVVLAAGFLAIAATGAAITSERVGVVAAAFLVALAFGPASLASQRLVNRLFYGQRDHPYQAVSDVGRRLAAVAEPGTLLPAVLGTVAASLRLRYVAIARAGDGVLVAVHGRAPDSAGLGRWPLSYQGVQVGVLIAAPRSGETGFGRRDEALLGDLAGQLGAAVHAEALTADLIESRQRLVNAREDERRRLRRELHDGLGPMLTGLGLNVDAARAQIAKAQIARAQIAKAQIAAAPAGGPAGTGAGAGAGELAVADDYLAHVKDASSRAIVDLRGIVYGLRPPALDDLGLVGAVRTHAQRLVAGSRTDVSVEVGQLGELPAAVEVAAYRIALESISNTLRHSDARTCRVRFDVSPQALVLQVEDDGSRAERWTPGVGLLGMRERAAELGGSLSAGPTGGGGQVRAVLPLTAAGTAEPA